MCASRNLARLLVALLLCLTPSLAWAQQQNVLPTGQGADNGWSEFSSPTTWEGVDDPVGSPNDSDGIFTGDDGARNNFTFPAFSFTSSAVTNVMIKIRTESASSTVTLRCYLVIGGTRYFAANITVDTTYEDRDCGTWATDPSTAAAWTESGVETTIQSAGVEAVTLGGIAVGISQFYMQANYTPSGGGGGSTQKRRIFFGVGP
jgi:hypothetical protein